MRHFYNAHPMGLNPQSIKAMGASCLIIKVIFTSFSKNKNFKNNTSFNIKLKK